MHTGIDEEDAADTHTWTDLELAELCKRIDPQNRGKFSFKQLDEIIRQRGKDAESLQDVIDALKVFDTDRDGMLTYDEFIYAMTNMGEKMTEEEVKEILEESDLQSLTTIKIDEFASMIMNRI